MTRLIHPPHTRTKHRGLSTPGYDTANPPSNKSRSYTFKPHQPQYHYQTSSLEPWEASTRRAGSSAAKAERRTDSHTTYTHRGTRSLVSMHQRTARLRSYKQQGRKAKRHRSSQPWVPAPARQGTTPQAQDEQERTSTPYAHQLRIATFNCRGINAITKRQEI